MLFHCRFSFFFSFWCLQSKIRDSLYQTNLTIVLWVHDITSSYFGMSVLLSSKKSSSGLHWLVLKPFGLNVLPGPVASQTSSNMLQKRQCQPLVKSHLQSVTSKQSFVSLCLLLLHNKDLFCPPLRLPSLVLRLSPVEPKGKKVWTYVTFSYPLLLKPVHREVAFFLLVHQKFYNMMKNQD